MTEVNSREINLYFRNRMLTKRFLEECTVSGFVISDLDKGVGFQLRDPSEGAFRHLCIEGRFQLLQRISIIQYRNIAVAQISRKRRADAEIGQGRAANHNARGDAATLQQL